MEHTAPYIDPSTFHIVEDGEERYIVKVPRCTVYRADGPGLTALQLLSRTPRTYPVEALLADITDPVRTAVQEWIAVLARGRFPLPAVSPVQPTTPLLPAVEMCLTHRCTLRCQYCYSDHEHRPHDVPLDMPDAVMDAAITWVAHEFLPASPRVHITAGTTGEALLRLDAYRRLGEKCEQMSASTGRQITYSIGNTNLILADQEEVWKFLTESPQHISSVSIDGPSEFHDALRRFPDGRGSYNHLVPLLVRLLQHGNSLTGQAVITGQYPDLISRFLHFHEMGLSYVAFRPVRARSHDAFAINRDTIDSVIQGFN